MDKKGQSATELVVISSGIGPPAESVFPSGMPGLVADAGPAARFAYDEFFFGRLRNAHTRKAYRHAVHRFLASWEPLGVELSQISPRHVGQYLDRLSLSPSTKKQHLAALR